MLALVCAQLYRWSETQPRGMNDAPFFAMSEYDFRSKCVVVGCQKRGFRRELFVRDDCASTWQVRVKTRGSCSEVTNRSPINDEQIALSARRLQTAWKHSNQLMLDAALFVEETSLGAHDVVTICWTSWPWPWRIAEQTCGACCACW